MYTAVINAGQAIRLFKLTIINIVCYLIRKKKKKIIKETDTYRTRKRISPGSSMRY